MTRCDVYSMDQELRCVCGCLRRASRSLTRLYDDALAPTGLTVTQFSVMRTLERLDRPTLNALSEATAHERSALWRTIQPLVRKGWIASDIETGVRAQSLFLTPTGREKLVDALPMWRSAQTQVSDALGPGEATLIALLEEVETHV